MISDFAQHLRSGIILVTTVVVTPTTDEVFGSGAAVSAGS